MADINLKYDGHFWQLYDDGTDYVIEIGHDLILEAID